MEMQAYKCPCCGGSIGFNSEIQKMKCPYCDTEFEMETLKAYDEELKNEPDDHIQFDSRSKDWSEEEGAQVYLCESCAGELLTDGNTAATNCPYCGSPTVLLGRLSGSLKPDLVIPFRLDKDAAVTAFGRHLKGKRLLPKVFKDEAHLKEIQGIYVPFWLFDGDADGTVRFRASRTRTWADSRFEHTETSYFSVHRGGSLSFTGIPVDGSKKMPDDLMESLEPYDFSKAVDFQTAYLAGYLADKYDVDVDTSVARAGERMKTSTIAALTATVHGYTGLIPEHTAVKLHRGEVKYALLPVWLLKTTWRGQTYTFAMNGQTGRFVGNLPLDKGAFWKWFALVAAGSSATVFALNYLLWLL